MATKIEWKLPKTKDEEVLGQEVLEERPLDKATGGSDGAKKIEWKLPTNRSQASAQEAAMLGGSSTRKGEDYLSNFDFTTKVGGDNELLRAHRQPWAEQFGGFLNQAVVGEIIGGTLEGTGYLLDMAENLGTQKGTEDEWGNFLSDIGKAMKTWTRDVTPIHQTAPGTFNMWDSGWWFGNGVSVASTLSLMIPAAGAVRGLSFLGRGLGMTSRLGKIANWSSKVATGAELGLQGTRALKIGAAGIGQATLSRHMENMMEASGVFEEQYNKHLGEGMDEIAAREAASIAASQTYKMDWWMLAMDIPQYLAMGSIFKPAVVANTGKVAAAANKAAGATLQSSGKLGRGAKYFGGMVTEGFEEAFQHIAAEEGKYIGDLSAGTTKKSAFDDRLDEYVKDGEMWTAAFFGALGGGVFQAALPAVQKGLAEVTGKPTSATQAAQIRIDNIQSWAAQLSAANKRIKEADSTGSYRWMREARDHANELMAIKAAQSGNGQIHVDHLEHLLNMSEEEVNEYNANNKGNELDMDFIKEYVPGAIEQSKKIIDLYNENSNKYDPQIAAALTQEQYKIEKYGGDISELTSKLQELEAKYLPLTDKLSPVGSEMFETSKEIKALREEKRQIRYLLRSNQVHGDTKEFYNNKLDQIEQLIDLRKANLKEQKRKKRTSEERNQDTIVFKSLDSFNKLDNKRGYIKFLESEIERATDNVAKLTDPKVIDFNNQEALAKAGVSNTIEELVEASGIEGALHSLRSTGKLPEGLEIGLDGVKGTIERGTETEIDEKSKKSSIKGGYVFISEDGSIIKAITPENIDSLYVASKEEREYSKKMRDLINRGQSMNKLISELDSNLTTTINNIEELDERLETNKDKLAELLSDLNVAKSFDKRRKDTKEFINKLESQIKDTKALIDEYTLLKEIYEENKITLQEELILAEEEVNSLRNDYQLSANTTQLTKGSEETRRTAIKALEESLGTVEELQTSITQTVDAIGIVENTIASLEIDLQALEDLYTPAEAAELILTRDTSEKEFAAKYPGAPDKKALFSNLDPNKKSGHLISYIRNNPNFLEDLRNLKKVVRDSQNSEYSIRQIKYEILGTKANIAKAKMTLRGLVNRKNQQINNRNQLQRLKALSRVYEKLIRNYREHMLTLAEMESNATTTVDGQNVHIKEVPTKAPPKTSKKYDDGFQYKKSSILTTAGLHIQDGKITDREMEALWFSAMTKLPRISSEDGYYLKVVTLETYPDAFDAADKENNTDTSLKAILVDAEGNPITSDEKGNIGKGELPLATYIHVESFVDKLDPNALANRYIQETLKLKEGIDAFNKDGILKIGKDEYTLEQIIGLANKQAKKAISEMRNRALEDIKDGKDVYLEINKKSNGIPRRLGKKSDGSRNLRPIANFAKIDDIVSISVPTSEIHITSAGKRMKVFPGMPLVEDKEGNVIDGINRTLNKDEVKLIQQLLYYAANSQSKEKGLNNVVKNADKNNKKFPTFSLFNTGKERYGIIPTLLYYGKIKDPKKDKSRQIYISDGRLYFDVSNSIPVSEIKSNPELKEWLENKFVQIKHAKLGHTTTSYFAPKYFNERTGEIKGTWIKAKDGLGGYERHLLGNNVIGTDIVPRDQVQYASTYLEYDSTIKNNIEPKKPTTEAPVKKPVVTPTSTPTSRKISSTDIPSLEVGTEVKITRVIKGDIVEIIAVVVPLSSKNNELIFTDVTLNGRPFNSDNSKKVITAINDGNKGIGPIVDVGISSVTKIEVVTKQPSKPTQQASEVDNISTLLFEERIPALIKLGVLENVRYQFGPRHILVANIDGVKQAFYRSSEGTSGKEVGKWTPMFGFGFGKKTDTERTWLIKGGKSDYNAETPYGSDAIKKYADILNSTLNWDHTTDKTTKGKNHPYYKVLPGIKNIDDFNEFVYGKTDLEVTNGVNVTQWIDSKISNLPTQQTSNTRVERLEEAKKKIEAATTAEEIEKIREELQNNNDLIEKKYTAWITANEESMKEEVKDLVEDVKTNQEAELILTKVFMPRYIDSVISELEKEDTSTTTVKPSSAVAGIMGKVGGLKSKLTPEQIKAMKKSSEDNDSTKVCDA